ncbi:hypothetical protein MLD38_036822 [Melastoma candidum]|uniref:Uncharacterized protein n=1 Tax=Melastoma candidum TaxID=119954 RepID=A0ACB9LL31_9MYRT|nr:hypothetical protein MLD38_036822 [Melastoma candidum]
MLKRDPHGNVQVAKIETEKMLIQMVERSLRRGKRKELTKGTSKDSPTSLGTKEGVVYQQTSTPLTAMLWVMLPGLFFRVGNLASPVSEWTVGGTALTSLMDVERRHGKYKPVIKKAMVELDGAPFKKFASLREEWAVKNCYISPGPIQFVGPASDAVNHTLLLELGALA